VPPRLGWGMLKRFLLGGVAIVLLSAAAVSSALLLELKDDASIFERITQPLPSDVRDVLPDVDPGKPQTLLLLGSDRRYIDIKQKNPVRSDTLMLVRLDPDKDATAVMSLPRDLKVEIPTKRGAVTDKINAAYSRGGPALTVRTVRRLLGIPIHHVVNVNFGGFRKAVNRLGCVYVDVDRRYFHSNVGVPLSLRYAAIDVPAGYQKLCGQQALDYVRHRHSDNDFLRAARQQEFLRAAKGQIGVSQLLGDRKELIRIFGAYTQTDISGTAAILRLLKLGYESSKSPIREVRFPGEQAEGDTYVTIGDAALRRTVRQFTAVRSSAQAQQTPAGSRRSTAPRRRRRTSPGLARGLIRDRTGGEDHVTDLSIRAGFPVYFPGARLAKGTYVGDRGPRRYAIADRRRRRYPAYRLVLSAGEIGQFYGVQGTTWRKPPILNGASDRLRLRGRTYRVFYDGQRIRMIAWRTPRAVYWVSNTLSQRLTNAQMRGVAGSLRRLGAQ